VIIPPGALAGTADEGAVLRRCLETRPDDPNLRAPLAHFLRNRGQIAEARAILEPGLRAPRDDPEMRLEDLACRLDEGDIASARPWFERPSDDLPARGRYWLLRGDWLQMQDRWDEARENYREAARRDPRDPQVRYRLSRACRASGRVREAEEALAAYQRLEQLSRLAAEIPETAPDVGRLVQAARLCHALDRDREARAWYVAVLRLDPSHDEARRYLAQPAPRDRGPAVRTAAPPDQPGPPP
jgi:tetratricopeptide (TPR) repeat protein